MVSSHDTAAIADENKRSLHTLIRAITLTSDRRFSLILARCNYNFLQEQVMQELREQCPIAIPELELSPSAQNLYTEIKGTFCNEQLPGLIVLGLDKLVNLNNVLIATNQIRNEFSKGFHFPLVLWVTDEVLKTMVKLAPDFQSWSASPISFRLPPEALVEFLRQESEVLFAEIIEPQREDCRTTNLGKQEVEFALKNLRDRDYPLDPDLEASLQFCIGWHDYQNDCLEEAIAAYQKSLSFWQQTNNWERQGVLLFHLGLCALRRTELERTQTESHLQSAKQDFQQCLAVLTTAERFDLKANFIGYLGEVLKRLGQWEELQHLVAESLELHRRDRNSANLARDYGFLAEIALKQDNNGTKASEYARQALQILEEAPADCQQDRGLYLLLLAQAQQHLERLDDAIATLLQAKRHSHPSDNLQCYLQILEALRELYFEKKSYLDAFHCKQEKQSIENQYGFRAFIGAGCLQPPKTITTNADRRKAVAREISVSSRQKDVERLIERLSRNDCKLTILYGQLGVGKSSIVRAGLVPLLQDRLIEARDISVLLLRSYTHWIDKLGKQLARQIQSEREESIEIPSSIEEIREQLVQNEARNRLTVLIFDQFEEFFFVCKSRTERQALFQLLSECLTIPYVKIILSLREDYLHYLLEWERYDSLDAIEDDILSTRHRYELGDFSPQDARNIIQSLTARSQLYLEPELIDRIVQDLAGEFAEVRPIELQIVGAQLQSDKITTLKQYEDLGENPKEKLVKNYLNEVVLDCGEENRREAELVLFLLTDENNNRPPKTREELETDIKALEKDLVQEPDKLDLVLEIFQKSGLVFLLPESPSNRYQLVHDYLVSFIRQQQPRIDRLVKELEVKREELNKTQEQLRISELERQITEEQRKRSEVESERSRIKLKLIQNQRKAIFILSSFVVFFVIFITVTIANTAIKKAEENSSLRIQIGVTLSLRIKYAEDLLEYNNPDGALVEMLKAGQSLKDRYHSDNNYFSVSPESRATEVIHTLQKTLSPVVKNKQLLAQQNSDVYKKDINNLTTEDQYDILISLLDIGCTYVLPQELEKRKWKSALCD